MELVLDQLDPLATVGEEHLRETVEDVEADVAAGPDVLGAHGGV